MMGEHVEDAFGGPPGTLRFGTGLTPSSEDGPDQDHRILTAVCLG